MVLLINSNCGFNQIKDHLSKNDCFIWYSKGTLGNEELMYIQKFEVEYTELNFEFDLRDTNSREEILDMIKEHHPKSSIFCEMPK